MNVYDELNHEIQKVDKIPHELKEEICWFASDSFKRPFSLTGETLRIGTRYPSKLHELQDSLLVENIAYCLKKSQVNYLVFDFDNVVKDGRIDITDWKNGIGMYDFLTLVFEKDNYINLSSEQGIHLWFRVSKSVFEALGPLKTKVKLTDKKSIEIFYETKVIRMNNCTVKGDFEDEVIVLRSASKAPKIRTITKDSLVFQKIKRIFARTSVLEQNKSELKTLQQSITKTEFSFLEETLEENYNKLIQLVLNENITKKARYRFLINSPKKSEQDFAYLQWILPYVVKLGLTKKESMYLAIYSIKRDRPREKLARFDYLALTTSKVFLNHTDRKEIKGEQCESRQKIFSAPPVTQQRSLHVINIWSQLISLDRPIDRQSQPSLTYEIPLSATQTATLKAERKFYAYEVALLINLFASLQDVIKDNTISDTNTANSMLKRMEAAPPYIINLSYKNMKFYPGVQGSSGRNQIREFLRLLRTTSINITDVTEPNSHFFFQILTVSTESKRTGLQISVAPIFMMPLKYQRSLYYFPINEDDWKRLRITAKSKQMANQREAIYIYLCGTTRFGYPERFSLIKITKNLYSNYDRNLPNSQSKNRRNVLTKIKEVIQLTEDFSLLGIEDDTLIIFRHKRTKANILPGNFEMS